MNGQLSSSTHVFLYPGNMLTVCWVAVSCYLMCLLCGIRDSFVLLWQISIQLYVGREKALTLVCVQSMQLSTSATLCRTLPTPASPQPSSRCWTSG